MRKISNPFLYFCPSCGLQYATLQNPVVLFLLIILEITCRELHKNGQNKIAVNLIVTGLIT